MLALLLAFLIAGGVFYGVGRRAGILPGRLAAQPTMPTPSAALLEGPATTVVPIPSGEPTGFIAAASTPTAVPEGSPAASPLVSSPAPSPAVSPAPPPALPRQAAARDVTPTAASGGGGILLLAGGLAMIIGGGAMIAAAKRWHD